MTIDNLNNARHRFRSYVKKRCNIKTVKKRLPITQWLPKYNASILIQDLIAGITVGLTAIPQGMAYAVVAGLSPEYGLYSGLTGGFVYLIFGSSKDITVGPTAVLSTMVAKHVSEYSSDFAVLAAFLAGVIELVCGILHLGFLVDFISIPVTTGFTTAAALQIAASQLKSLFGLAGSSGNCFTESMYNFVNNIQTARLWDSMLGFSTIVILIVLKYIGRDCYRQDSLGKQIRWFVSIGRNAIVVVVGIGVAFVISNISNNKPLKLIGEIESGMPIFKPPPFNTVVGNKTFTFGDMMQALGPQSIVLPFVAILESVAIAKAFAGGAPVDASQEMIALGLCNIVGSFVRSMPTTGSFTRTALNHASGVQTPAGGIFTGLLIILALSLMTSTFYFIPKATLAGLIVVAMYSMVDCVIFCRFWKSSKRELIPLLVTILISLFYGLEYGIVSGILIDACISMCLLSRPKLKIRNLKRNNGELTIVPLVGNVQYCSAEHVRRTILRTSNRLPAGATLVIDASNMHSMDTTVASNLMSVAKDLEEKCRILFWNFSASSKKMCVDINPNFEDKFVVLPNPMEIDFVTQL